MFILFFSIAHLPQPQTNNRTAATYLIDCLFFFLFDIKTSLSVSYEDVPCVVSFFIWLFYIFDELMMGLAVNFIP